jgi:cell division protein FtsA
VRLEAEVHIIICSVTSAQNLVKCVNGAGLMVNDLVLQSLAAGRAVLTPEETEMGVALIDLGGGTTDVLVYADDAPYSNATIPVGGGMITSDISKLKSIAFDTAEQIKIEAGCCWEDLLEADDDIIVPMVGGRPPMAIPRSHILEIIQPRMDEIFKMVKEKLDKLPLSRPLGGGVVLTGGGAQLLGAAELASQIFKLPVRIGNPLPMGGLGLVEDYRNPIYATAMGLVLEGDEREGWELVERPGDTRRGNGEPSAFGKFVHWIKNEFF